MHCVRQVTDKLYWVGANDHRLQLFENIHPIPRGVSYNAYLLLEEETVLFDTVDWSVCRQFLENVEYLLHGKPLNYVVVHHMEPDHAASLKELLLRWPEVKIVATKKAFDMMGQFGISVEPAQAQAVKEGDTRTFGAHTVTFLTAPMVHWPEVMATYDETNGVLFSADAFGTFIALDGKLFADEVNFERDWLEEARRYYCNIVGKYGVQVQALLKKCGPLLDKIKYVCPLHGPVWRENFPWFVEKYDLWSRYQPENKGVLLVYGSMYGNTEAAAQILATQLCELGLRELAVYDVSQIHTSYLIAEAFRYSHIVLAAPTYNAELFPPMQHLLLDMKSLNLQNRTFALIENGCWASRAGALMKQFISGEMKNMSLLEETVSLSSALRDGQDDSLTTLARALMESVGT